MRYNLARMARSSRRKRIVLPPITDSIGAQQDYLQALRAMLRSLSEMVRSDVLPAAEAEIARQRAVLTQDAPFDGVFTRVRQVAVYLGQVANGLVGRILNTESRRHSKKWVASVRQAIGIDISAVVSEEDIANHVEAAAAKNASLITNLAEDTISKVERAVYDAILSGKTAKELRADLTKQFGIADNRAKTIARDQVAKLTSDLNRIRHQQAGIDTYEWSTSKDERVRERHRKLEGREYRYGEPTGAEDGLPPGKPINCRCVARAVVTFAGERV